MKAENVYQRLAACRFEIGSIQRTAQNPFAKSKYAPLSEVLKACNDAMHNNSLYCEIQSLISETPGFFQYKVSIIDIITLERINLQYDIPIDNTMKNPVQGYGSTNTYAQRYIYGTIFGIPFDNEDPDARQPQQPAPVKTAPQKAELKIGTDTYKAAVKYLQGGGTLKEISAKYVFSEQTKQALLNDAEVIN